MQKIDLVNFYSFFLFAFTNQIFVVVVKTSSYCINIHKLFQCDTLKILTFEQSFNNTFTELGSHHLILALK